MTNRFRPAALLLAGLMLATPASAIDPVVDTSASVDLGLYATIFAGGAFYKNTVEQTFGGSPDTVSSELTMEPAIHIGGAVGVHLLDNLRAEIELSYSMSSLADQDGITPPADYESTSSQFAAMANVWYDIGTGSAIAPYIGGGLGASYTEFHDDKSKVESNGFAYQLGAGVRTELAGNLALDLGYRFRVMPDAVIEVNESGPPPGNTAKNTGTNHVIQAGLSFAF